MHAIILDRDGVINFESDAFIKSPDEWRPIPGSLEAIVRFHRAGWKVLVATNQSGLARGLFDDKTLAAIHAKMHRAVQDAGGWIDDLAFCPHGPDSDCPCRKPKPGLLLHLAHKWRLDLNTVPCVGDSLRDLQAAQAVGCSPILVQTGNGRKTEREALPAGTRVFADLGAVAEALLSGASHRAA